MVKTLRSRRVLVLLAIALLGFSAFTSIQVSANAKTYQNRSASGLEEYTSTASNDSDPMEYNSFQRISRVFHGGYVDPELPNAIGPTRVLILASDGLPPNEVANYMISGRATPSFNGFYAMTGVMLADNVQQLSDDPRVLALLKDRKIQYSVPTEFPDIESLTEKTRFRPEDPRFKGEPFVGKQEPTLREVVNITGARKAWETYNINGTDVTVAFVDTGVDYGAFSLGYWDVVARDSLGFPAAFDADGECMALTSITVTAYENTTGKFIPTAGMDPNIYIFGEVHRFSELTDPPSLWTWDMNVTGIVSQSGNYHFGLMYQYLFGFDLFPVLVVDSNIEGIYDTVYVDLSFDWAWLNLQYGLPFGTWPPEFSFADETPVTPTNWTIAARDFTGDGIYDLSAGSLGYFLDVWRASPNVADRGLVLKPVDPAGNYVAFVNDWWGHGTYCASSAGGRDVNKILPHPNASSGIAPGVKVMGIVALWIGDIIEAELWAAGFDLIPGTEGWSDLIPGYGWVWGTWNYTGNHKADIISNSWGWSTWAEELQGLSWYDPLTILEDALMIPGYLDPNYPGTVVVHAGGNGAPGYGTFTSPGYATLPISVGASTSLATTASSLFGLGGGYFNDVISWSATGPTPLGCVKPDVVDVGAWAWVPGPIWSGLGDGWNAVDYFGGTSMATPLTSGSVALLIQGYTEAHGTKPTPEAAKVILKSTAKDLGYDVFLQGSGRVDCFAAVSLALGESGMSIASSITWENVRPKIQYAWFMAYESLGDPLQLSPPIGPVNDTSWFAGIVHPDDSTSAKFTVTNPTNHNITADIVPLVHEQISTTIVHKGNTTSLEGWLDGYGAQFTLNVSEIPPEADLMVATLTVPYTYFDPDGDYTWNNRFRIFILDWNDTNLDGFIDPVEVFNINYGYDTGTTCEARVGFPLSKFKGKPVIWVSQRSQPWIPMLPVPYEVHVSYYKRNNLAWVTAPLAINVEANSSETFTAQLMVPSGTSQGVYEGQIMVDIVDPYTRTIIIPVSLVVPMVLSSGDLALDITPPAKTELYDPYRVNGHFDWRWRYESGDWKIWVFDVQDPNTIAAFISSNWTGARTDIDMFGINPMGILVDAAMSPYTYTGPQGPNFFRWRTRTETTEEYLVLNTSMFATPVTGLYTALLHNVLFDGTTFPENVTGRVELVKLAPRGPVGVATRAGKSASQNFTITTGRKLTNVTMSALYPFTSLPVEITPEYVPEIGAMNSTEFSVRVNVPEGTPEGTYQVTVYLVSSELPFTVNALVNLTVDNTPPMVSIVSPKGGEFISGNVTIEAYASDPSGIETVEFGVDTTSAPMTFNSTTGHWIGSLDTTTLSDGTYNLNVSALDKAGNGVAEMATVTVDNTEPTVSITSPEDGAELSGTVNINFTGTDDNLDKVSLYIDNATFDVTGETSYEWDTTTVGDSTHTIKLVAYDKAGNTNETAITVTTINVKRKIEATRNLYLGVGTPIGFIIGAIIAYVITRRRP